MNKNKIKAFATAMLGALFLYSIALNLQSSNHLFSLQGMCATYSSATADRDGEMRIEVIELETIRYVRDLNREAALETELNHWRDKYIQHVSVPGFTYVGKFRITGYCSGPICTGKYAASRIWTGNREIAITASGAVAEVGITVAVDTDIIPWGTAIYIEGLGIRIAQDVGGSVRGRHIDVFFGGHSGAHEEALEWGSQYRAVWIVDGSSINGMIYTIVGR